jgi:hypothetical protein
MSLIGIKSIEELGLQSPAPRFSFSLAHDFLLLLAGLTSYSCSFSFSFLPEPACERRDSERVPSSGETGRRFQKRLFSPSLSV